MGALRQYEFHVYAVSEDGDVSDNPERVDQLDCFTQGAAIAAARKLTRASQAPVDVARSGPSPWNDRYVGTAMSAYPGSGSRLTLFGRLD